MRRLVHAAPAAAATWERDLDQVRQGSDVLFILLGAVMVLAMHAGFAFLELGTVRTKNQVNALVKILVDFAVSTVAYFFVGYTIAYGVDFFVGAEHAGAEERLRAGQVLLPADLRRGYSRPSSRAASPSARASARSSSPPRCWSASSIRCSKASPGASASASRAGSRRAPGAEFHDFAGSVVVHAVGGWVGLAAVLLLGARRNRYRKDGAISAHPPSIDPVPRARRLDADASAGSAST